ncbi:MAG: hypothetical protein A3D52_01230 [Candidatus Taylorbacteria bacterium RIFCSPHIGHO2_02_FULL_44_36]|nr:MAG: hypothetical protein A3D52_01230 [Candidatus Taylorbacteria bacterium RIFCSPHIGHO2_02_FULL_44_36]OHA38882.1 MAG: hypothetical protein A3I97_01350 [Candidatus Taylorbacteria bacterium RIFCSPLOWO2_02_FULL_44_35]
MGSVICGARFTTVPAVRPGVVQYPRQAIETTSPLAANRLARVTNKVKQMYKATQFCTLGLRLADNMVMIA